MHIAPVKAATSPEAEALAGAIDAMLPGVRITEALHEVSRETGFSAAFTNLRTGEACDNENALLAAELGDQVGLQFRPAAFQLRLRTVRIRPLGWREPDSNLSVPRDTTKVPRPAHVDPA